MVGNEAITTDNWRGVDRKAPRSAQPFPGAPVTTQTAPRAYQLVLDNAGATFPKRDAVDARVVGQMRNGGGRIINSQKDVGGYPKLKAADPLKFVDYTELKNNIHTTEYP